SLPLFTYSLTVAHSLLFMSLDFQQLTQPISEMAENASGLLMVQQQSLDELLSFFAEHATEWESFERVRRFIEQNILQATQARPFRGIAIPFKQNGLPLNQPLPLAAKHLPDIATIVAVDGSQIVPDRHGAFIYYLINTGGIAYHHGQRRAPDTFSDAELFFPLLDDKKSDLFASATEVGVKRDIAEINRLAEKSLEHRSGAGPVLAIMDQRLLYVPIGDIPPQVKRDIIQQWQAGMEKVEASGGVLVGFIDRPGKSRVVTMLRALHPDWSPQEVNDLGDWEGLTDAMLFSQLLGPGERSPLFVDLSHANHRFKQESPNNEICFFFLNSSQKEDQPNIVRVDLPLWVAQNRETVGMIHALLYDQCTILGGNPYVIARAHEEAVVSRRDQQELEFRIAKRFEALGIYQEESLKERYKQMTVTPKQSFN
ncbi:MAG: DNA double-strand break repair nuclease NurA, partial [Chloroflexota bacterium]